MKSEDKWALIASAFIPWILAWVLSYGFTGPDGWREAVRFAGVAWLAVSPLVTLLLLRLCVQATREGSKK